MLPRSINKKLVEKQIPVEWQMEDSETESESNDEKENDEDYEYLINNNKDNEILNNLYKELLHIDDDENGNKCYSYKCEKLLKTNLEEHLLDIDENGLRPKIYIYAYNVNTSGSYPFLQYFFHKNKKIEDETENKCEELLSVPQFVYSDVFEVLSKSISILTMICLSYHRELLYNFKGYYQEDNESLLLFFDCSKLNIEKINITKYTDLVLVLIDEIINYKKMGNIKIEEIHQYISDEWLRPFDQKNLLLDQEDLSRIELIYEMSKNLGVNDEGISIILHLIDQLNFILMNSVENKSLV